jgi:rubrerythrin
MPDRFDALDPRLAQGQPTPAVAPRPVAAASRSTASDKTICERCGAEMYRMHAVWRCPACGFKTDCCGW